jgi:hypothetical protein
MTGDQATLVGEWSALRSLRQGCQGCGETVILVQWTEKMLGKKEGHILVGLSLGTQDGCGGRWCLAFGVVGEESSRVWNRDDQ